MARSQELPDANLDNWTSYPVDTRFYEEPTSGWWATLNPLARLAPIAPITVTKVSGANAYNGNAARLETKSFVGLKLPGLLCAGTYLNPSISNPFQTIVYGKPFVWSPRTFKLYYKYLPSNIDSFGVYIMLYKYNPALHRKDTIADIGYTGGPSSVYQLLELTLNYRMNGVTPDSIIFNLSSSAAADGANGGQAGSALYVDEISFETNTGMEYTLTPDADVRIFPNPADKILNINISPFTGFEIVKIYNSTGQLIRDFIAESELSSFDISEFKKGVYIVNVMNEGRLVSSTLFQK